MAWLCRAIIHVLFLTSVRPVFSSSNEKSLVWSSETCDEHVKSKTAICSERRLSTVPDDLQRDLEILDLSRNNINSLTNTSFNRYSNLVDLNLQDSNLSTIETGALRPLKLLEVLNLSMNRNILIPSGKMFKWLVNLIHLNLHTSYLETLPSDILRWLPTLQLVTLKHNKIEFMNITKCGTGPNFTMDLSYNDFKNINAETFVLTCNCDTLNLDLNPVRKVDADVISSLSVRSLLITVSNKDPHVLSQLFEGISKSIIREVKISDMFMRINRFPPWIFDSMHDKSLSVLNIHLTSLNFLQPMIFANLSRVAQLDINTFDLKNLDPDVFHGMSQLRILKFHGQLKIVNEHDLKWDLDLRILNLSHNDLQALDWNAFIGLENVTHLDLSENLKLTFLNITESSGLSSLNTMNLRGTSLITVSIHAPLLKSFTFSGYYNVPHGDDFVNLFSHTQLLDQIDIRFTAIVSLWYSKYNQSLFRGLQNLTTLRLSENCMLTKLQNGTFLDQNSLAELDLRSCKLNTIESGAFKGLKSLYTLRLEKNELQTLPKNVFYGIKQITNLHLDHNLLTSFDNHIFTDMIISSLTLSDNHLVKLSPAVVRPVESVLNSIDISRNPLECSCEIEWLLKWLQESTEVMNPNLTLCSSASMRPFREKPIMSLNLSDHCTPNLPLYFSIFLASTLICVALMVMYINRWVLKYKIFLMKLKIFGYAVMQDPREHTDYRYDLNVMFCDDDREWARGYLRPGLEEKLPHFVRTAYGDEDLTPGMFYLEAVLELVENSFKTILLLSRAAILNGWFMHKFRLTLDYVNDIQTENVLVIFIEEIPKEEQPYRLRLYIDDGRPHLTWMENEQNQENFWTELLGSITVNLTRTHLIPHE